LFLSVLNLDLVNRTGSGFSGRSSEIAVLITSRISEVLFLFRGDLTTAMDRANASSGNCTTAGCLPIFLYTYCVSEGSLQEGIVT